MLYNVAMRQRLFNLFSPVIMLASTGASILVCTILYFVPIDLAYKIGIYTILVFTFNFAAIAWDDQRRFKRAAIEASKNIPDAGTFEFMYKNRSYHGKVKVIKDESTTIN
jgi:hypothetical protein